jgi:hypothetical protein
VKSIDPLGKDTDVAGIFGIEAVIDGDKLSFVISDDMKNLHVYTYAPLSTLEGFFSIFLKDKKKIKKR